MSEETVTAPSSNHSDDFIAEITTDVEPTKKFTIDKVEYELLGFEHLSDEQEVKATAAFARHMRLMRALDEAQSIGASEKIAAKLQSSRVTLLSMLTTAPEETIRELPLVAQARLLEVIQSEVGANDVIPE